jgi:uncharacterized protein
LKIDIYSHIMPKKYLAALSKVSPQVSDSWEVKNRANVDLETRLRLMDRYPDVLQVLTVSLPPLDVVPPADAIELAKTANDELAELVVKYPDKFIAAAACVPLNDMDATLKETDRAITQLGLKGIQLFARVYGDTLDNPRYKPLYEKMAKYDLPIWIHPIHDHINKEPSFALIGWPFATSTAMSALVASGTFNQFPDIKFITHHCGAMIPTLEGRLKWLFPNKFKMGEPGRNWVDHFRKFYNDTATYGSTPALMCGYAYFGADHLLFGSDSPLGPTNGVTLETIKAIERMQIPDPEKEKLFSENAIRLLKIAT